ncbi:hypothetical protein KXV70_002224 [Aspergillus fumigatus]|nr:hypothetical protein KXV70_002224 [Aspergillus fumigatus]KAH3445498.1 hypothetical protein KXV91_003124 [Aspergillus fumigatus]
MAWAEEQLAQASSATCENRTETTLSGAANFITTASHNERRHEPIYCEPEVRVPGPATISGGYERKRAALREKLFRMLPEQNVRKLNLEANRDPFTSSVFIQLPPKFQLQSMFEVAFTEANHVLPLFDVSVLRDLVEQHYSDPTVPPGKQPGRWAMLNAAIAVAIQLRTARGSYSEMTELSWHFFKNSFSMYSVIALRAADVLGLEALLAMAICTQGSSDVRTTSVLSWIINEALRRTIPMGYTYIAFNALLKWSGCKDINMTDPCHFVRVHRWTASGSLWRADSSPAFFLPWHRQRQTFVQNFFIEDFAGLVWPVDVDLLSWIMLVAFVSVATVEEFIIEKHLPDEAIGELLVEGPILLDRYIGGGPDVATFVTPTWLLKGCGDFQDAKDDSSRQATWSSIGGERVELAEVEYHVRRFLPGRAGVAAEMITSIARVKPILVAFIAIGDEVNLPLGASLQPLTVGVNEKLAQYVPRTFIPEVYIPVETIPLTAAGKTDRKALRKMGGPTTLDEISRLQESRLKN